MLYYNISQYIHMPDKGWCLSDFGSAFLQLNTRNGAMPLNPSSKLPLYVVFVVLHEFCVVCILYNKHVVCVFYFLFCILTVVQNCLSLNFSFLLFWNWKWNGSCFMQAYSWVSPILKSNQKNVIPAGPSYRICDDSFTPSCLSLTLYFSAFF